MNTLGFIGVGNLAEYTIKGLRQGGFDKPILLSPRNNHKAQLLMNQCQCEVMTSNQAVVDSSDVIVLATRPADCIEVLKKLVFNPDQLLISVAAGISVGSLRQAVSLEIPIVRAMPVNCAEAVASPTLIYPYHPAVQVLFDYCGNAIVVDDEAAFEQGSVIACVYTWFFELFENLVQCTSNDVLSKKLATDLVFGMAKGAASLAMHEKSSTPGDIANRIATEGTYSKLGLDVLKKQDAFQPWQNACQLLAKRLMQDK